MNALAEVIGKAAPGLVAELDAIYKDIHLHPERLMQEVRTAKRAAEASQ